MDDRLLRSFSHLLRRRKVECRKFIVVFLCLFDVLNLAFFAKITNAKLYGDTPVLRVGFN